MYLQYWLKSFECFYREFLVLSSELVKCVAMISFKGIYSAVPMEVLEIPFTRPPFEPKYMKARKVNIERTRGHTVWARFEGKETCVFAVTVGSPAYGPRLQEWVGPVGGVSRGGEDIPYMILSIASEIPPQTGVHEIINPLFCELALNICSLLCMCSDTFKGGFRGRREREPPNSLCNISGPGRVVNIL